MASIRTDLAMESAQAMGEHIQGVQVTEEKAQYPGAFVHTVEVLDEQGEQAIGKPKGIYVTITSEEMTQDEPATEKAIAEALKEKLLEMLKTPPDKDPPILIVGLGNREITADSLGPGVVDDILVTRHLLRYLPEYLDKRANNVCAIAPGVLGDTGIETEEVVRSIVGQIHPSCVIAIDSLASRSIKRIATTVQLANTGIAPGAGVGNHRPKLDEKSLGIPVIAIGVPMVVYAATIVEEAAEQALANPQIGQSCREKVGEIVKSDCGDMVVTPKEIDKIVRSCAAMIANGINMAVHGIEYDEVQRFLQ